MLPGWGSVPSLGSFRTPRLSNKSLLIWKIGIFKIGFSSGASSCHLGLKLRGFTVISNSLIPFSIWSVVFASYFMVLNIWKKTGGWGGGGFEHSVVLQVFPHLLSFWHLGVDDNRVGRGWGYSVEGGEAQCVQESRGQDADRGGGRLLVPDLFTDPPFSGSVRGAVIVGGCCVAMPFLLRFHPLRFGLVLQFSVLPLGREGRRGWGVGRQEMKRVCNGW